MDQRGTRAFEPLVLAVVVFAACLFGIYTRPVGFLAALWPANAIMLGLLLRRPAMARPWGWVAACVAYVAADLLTGSPLLKALLLNAANVLGVGAAYVFCVRLSEEKRRLEHPAALLHLMLGIALGSAVAGLVGVFANQILFGGGAVTGGMLWFSSEFVNYVAILPVIASVASFSASGFTWAKACRFVLSQRALPILALVLTFWAGMVVGGPGAIAFPVPALLWCALVYSVFPTTVLTLLFTIWSLAIVSTNYLTDAQGLLDEAALISVRLAASLIALGPIMLSVVMQNSKKLQSRLQYLATHDQLTGVANRHAFRETVQDLVDQGIPVAALLLDLDRFKSINDRYGHAAGDEVLELFAQRVRACMRACDVFGRIGGEEFAVVVPRCARMADAIHVAERIRTSVSRSPLLLKDGQTIELTVSVGVSLSSGMKTPLDIDQLLQSADEALYSAKAKGRDRVEMQDSAEAS